MKPEDCGPVGVSVESMLRSKTLSSDMKDRISKADVNGDGVLSIDELVEVVRSEQSAVASQRLFRKLLIFFSVLMLLTVAAVVGCVYAIVDLQNQVKDDNNVLMSKYSEEVMSVGESKQLSSNFSSLLGPEGLDLALGLERIILPNEDFSSAKIYSVSMIELGQPTAGATIVTTSGDVFEVDEAGELFKVTNSTGGMGRRLKVVGTAGGGPPAMTSSMVPTHTPLGPVSDEYKLRRESCDEWIKIAWKNYEKKGKGRNGQPKAFVYPSGMPMNCRMQARIASIPRIF